MKPAVLLAVTFTSLGYALPTFAQETPGVALPLAPAALSPGPAPANSVRIRSMQPPTVPHVHRNVSVRRLALGALIGGAAGAALGYGLGSKSCGATDSRQECEGYGRLGATVMGGVGVFLGVHIALGTP